MSRNTSLFYQKVARFLSVACGFLFSIFSFVYLYLLQDEIVRTLHFSLSQGKTHYVPLAGATIMTVVLLLLRWGMNKLTKLKGLFYALSYFPVCLLLGILTDVDDSLFQEGTLWGKWMWLFPLLMCIYVGVVLLVRNMRCEQEFSVLSLVNVNLGSLIGLCLLTVCIGNTQSTFHYERSVEQAIERKDYATAKAIGLKSLETSQTLTALRAYALSQEGEMGEFLFGYPIPAGGADGLFFPTHGATTLHLNTDSLYTYLGARAHAGEKPLAYLARICHDDEGSHTALDYYLTALLLERKLSTFVEEIDANWVEQDSLPRYYREAVLLYQRMYDQANCEIQDSLMEQRLDAYLLRRSTFSKPLEEKNQMRREFGDTYWWYYHYQ